MSSAALGDEIDLAGAVDASTDSQVGVAHEAELLAFAEAVVTQDADVESTRFSLRAAVGEEAAAKAAEVVAAFTGLTRVADAIGIPVDEPMLEASLERSVQLDIVGYAGAANSDLAVERAIVEVRSMSDLM